MSGAEELVVDSLLLSDLRSYVGRVLGDLVELILTHFGILNHLGELIAPS